MGTPWIHHRSWSLVDEASEAIGRDVGHLLLDAEAGELTSTGNAQVATYVLSLVVLDAVRRTGIEPVACAGHSLGEYTALTATGAVSFAAGVRLVRARGDAMQAAADARPGTMAAIIGLDDDAAAAACERAGGDVWVANLNAPGQVVLSGDPQAVKAAGEAARALGARRVLPIPVGGAFHTPYMAPAIDELRGALAEAEIGRPAVPVVANVDAEAHVGEAEWADLLVAQLCSPVRWRQSLQHLAHEGVATFVEVGPGTVLTGLTKRTVADAGTVSLATPEDVERLAEAVPTPPSHPAVPPEGEHLHMAERLVVSPAAGVFSPADRWREHLTGTRVEVGDVLGTVGDEEVRSRFSGVIMGIIAHEGEQLLRSQPVAWLRTA